MLCEEVMQMKQELKERRKITDGQNLMIVPQKDALSIDIMFDEFSSFVSEEQGQKIDGIGEWMKNNNASIRIIAFSDNLTDKKADQELRKTSFGSHPEDIDREISHLSRTHFGIDTGSDGI